MKKKILTYAVIAVLASCNSVFAGNIDQIDFVNNQSDSNQDILAENQATQAHTSGDVSVSKETSSVNKDSQGSEVVLDTKVSEVKLNDAIDEKKNLETIDEKKRFFDIFNLQGGVQKADTNKEEFTEKTIMRSWLDGDYATGKWFGARPILEEHGLTINSSLLYSSFMKTGGGANGTKSDKGYSLFNMSVSLDTEKAGLWKGGTFYSLYQKKRGSGIAGPNGAMGDYMYFDGWEARQIGQISECWYQQKLFDNKVRLKIGKQDANIDFGYLNSGWDFMNLAFSVNPTTLMPTYPDPGSFGFMAEINPKEWLSLRNGIYNKLGIPFNITELEVKSKIKNLPGRYMIGAWEMANRSGFDVASSLDPNTLITNYNTYNRNFGFYSGAEQMVYKEKKNDENDMQGLVVFSQLGLSPSDRNDMCRYTSGGLHYKGLIPKRDKDLTGLAVGSGTFASRLGNITNQSGDETAIEGFYRAQVTPWIYLQPDVQFIMRPSGIYANSVAIGLRSVITF